MILPRCFIAAASVELTGRPVTFTSTVTPASSVSGETVALATTLAPSGVSPLMLRSSRLVSVKTASIDML